MKPAIRVENLGKQADMMTPALASAPSYLDENLKEVQITTVQNVADRTFFQRKNKWVDSALLAQEDDKPDRTVEFGTPEYMQLVQDLAKDNRQVALALGGDVLIQVGKERVLVKAP